MNKILQYSTIAYRKMLFLCNAKKISSLAKGIFLQNEGLRPKPESCLFVRIQSHEFSVFSSDSMNLLIEKCLSDELSTLEYI